MRMSHTWVMTAGVVMIEMASRADSRNADLRQSFLATPRWAAKQKCPGPTRRLTNPAESSALAENSYGFYVFSTALLYGCMDRRERDNAAQALLKINISPRR